MIPIEHSAALHEAIDERYRVEPFWAMGKGHNDMDYNFDPFIERVKDFLCDYVGDTYVEKRRKKKRRSESRRTQVLDDRLNSLL